MTGYWGIYRVTNQRFEIAKERALAMNAAATAIDILREPLPDTFLGRKHYELTPLPDQIELAPDPTRNDFSQVPFRIAVTQ
jgi:hypothetical protein